MNCREFTTIVSDLASASLMDAARRSDGQEHADGCGQCAARLADELALLGGLKSLSKTDIDSTPAPTAESEASLRAAFRKYQAEKLKTVKSIPEPLPSTDPGDSVRRRRLLLVAAALLALFGGSLLAAVVWPDRVDEQLHATGDDQPIKSADPRPTATPELNPVPVSDPSRTLGQTIVSAIRPTGKRANRIPVPGAGTESVDASEVTVSIGDFSPMTNESEVATDYIPLLLGADLPPVESGQVIRVQMPRSALASFGLPFNVERAEESVKADVLFGDDGLARAVRFVR